MQEKVVIARTLITLTTGPTARCLLYSGAAPSISITSRSLCRELAMSVLLTPTYEEETEDQRICP